MDVKSHWVRARSTPRAIVLALSASLGAIGAFMPTTAAQQAAGGRAGAHPAAASCSATPSPSCSRRRALRRRPIRFDARSWTPAAVSKHAADRIQAAPQHAQHSRSVAASATFVAPRPSSRPWHRETLERVASATGPVLALLEKARAQLEADVALGLTFQGSYSQTKPKEPAYGGHASAMGPAPANIPSPEDGAPVPVTFEVGAQLPHEDVLRRPDQGSHPRIGLRRRRAVRLRRRWAARHLSGDRGGAHAGA